jgi:hypothetical protein
VSAELAPAPEAIAAAAAAARARFAPDGCFSGPHARSHARWHALAALAEAFPDAPVAIARALGFGLSAARGARSTLRLEIRGARWWREDDRLAVRAALAAHLSGRAS